MKDEEYNKKVEELKTTKDTLRKYELQNQLRQERFRRKRTTEQQEQYKETLKEYRRKQKEELDKLRKERDKEVNLKEVASNIIKRNVKRKLAEQKVEEIKKQQEPIRKSTREVPQKTIELKPIKKGRAKKQETDIIPLHIKNPNAKLGQSSIDGYISKLNIINQLITSKPLDQPTKTQLIKMLEGKDFYQSVIEINMKYLKDINNVIKKLREEYQVDNTFRTYVNVLSVLLGRLKNYNKEYQQVAKLNIELVKGYNETRNENKLDEKDKGKIFSFNEEDIKENINKISNITDKIIYVLSVYLPRRLEIRKLILSKENNDDKNNYLIVDDNNVASEAIFKEYKTYKKHKEQKDNIPDSIKVIIKEYLDNNKIKLGDYILGQEKDRRLLIDQSNFSKRIKRIFTKLYGVEITNRWIRQSRITHEDGNKLEAVKEFERNAEKSGHSVAVHKQYIKTN